VWALWVGGSLREVVPEFVEVEVAVLRPEPACGRLGLSAKTMKEDRG
jgi:hypothetical protein